MGIFWRYILWLTGTKLFWISLLPIWIKMLWLLLRLIRLFHHVYSFKGKNEKYTYNPRIKKMLVLSFFYLTIWKAKKLLLIKLYDASFKLHVTCQNLLYIPKFVLSKFSFDMFLYKCVDHFIVLFGERGVSKSFRSPTQFMFQES